MPPQPTPAFGCSPLEERTLSALNAQLPKARVVLPQPCDTVNGKGIVSGSASLCISPESRPPDDEHQHDEPSVPVVLTPKQEAERAIHLGFMKEALAMARLALDTNETPVGCVLVYNGRVIARGMNATNVTRCGIRHAEYMAFGALLSHPPLAGKTTPVKDPPEWINVNPSTYYLYPYGQKLHPSPIVDPAIIKDCTLYVTVEPCIMCASMLRQYGVKKVYFGAVNDKFGGTGGVFQIHVNSNPAMVEEVLKSKAGGQKNRNRGPAEPRDPLNGDGGNVEMGYEASGGWCRDEAVDLLRSPVPRKKEGRAARLAALKGQDGATAPASPVPVSSLTAKGKDKENVEIKPAAFVESDPAGPSQLV